MNALADRSAERQAPAARLVARLRPLPFTWEEDARDVARTAPDAAAVFTHCARELAAALVECGPDPDRDTEGQA